MGERIPQSGVRKVLEKRALKRTMPTLLVWFCTIIWAQMAVLQDNTVWVNLRETPRYFLINQGEVWHLPLFIPSAVKGAPLNKPSKITLHGIHERESKEEPILLRRKASRTIQSEELFVSCQFKRSQVNNLRHVSVTFQVNNNTVTGNCLILL